MANHWDWGTYINLYVTSWILTGLVSAPLPYISTVALNPVSGRGYAAQAVTGPDWSVTSNAMTLNVDLNYTNMPTATITDIVFPNVMSWSLNTPVTIAEADRLKIPAGALKFRMVNGTSSVGHAVVGSSYLMGKIAAFVDAGTTLPAESRYLGLHNSGVEISGGGYTRKLLVGSQFQTAVLFDTVPTSTVNGWGIYDAVSGGNLLLSGDYLTSSSLTAGDQFYHNYDSTGHSTTLTLTMDIL